MKQALTNKFVIALVIAGIAGGIMYFTTWGNKKWLIDQIVEKGGTDPVATLQTMTVQQLRTKYKSLS